MILLALAYAAGMLAVHRKGSWWPTERAACWMAGVIAASVAGHGPLAAAAHHDPDAHMVAHLLLGMIAPLLLVLGAPVTLALRALPVRAARRLSRLLRSRPVRALTHPVTAAVLNAGGLWLIYLTDLHRAGGLVPWHILASGYLFTAAIVGVDPAPHRPGRVVRAAALIGFLAAHGILAKHLNSPLMYYGGDAVDLVLISLFCREWYRAADPHGPRTRRIPATRPPRVPWRLPDELRTAPAPSTPSGPSRSAAGPGQPIRATPANR
ncbi:cytochrome c oxidase assembly protein [Symbioplanes lichenis]|uniref:cytochrome c oxidase assembly protein n=1 Tax=Symbioplanes lichenis TaxID=1629072 RepID=UPI00273A2161|nr:cytochrome c oxidase assembly protein [Actinoplanes lichenis]